MSFFKKIKQPLFLSNFLKVSIPFFVIVTVFSLLFNNWKHISVGDFQKVAEINFYQGKWLRFFTVKLLVSVIYGLYVTNKKMK